MIPAHQIGLGQKELNGKTGAFGSEQEATGLIRIKTRLFDRKSHHDGGGIRHRWSTQQAGPGINPSHNGTRLNRINRFDKHAIADMHGFTPMAQTGATCAEEPRRNALWNHVQLHLQIIRLQRHDDSGSVAHC